MNIKKNDLNPNLDIHGILENNDNKILSDENFFLGKINNSGNNATIFSKNFDIVRINGLNNITDLCIGNYLHITGANNTQNNGEFLIIGINSNTSLNIINSNADINDTNNGNIIWKERSSYTLSDNIQFSQTDRKLIKGTLNWYDQLPTYLRPTNLNNNLPTNLTNISGKTTDALGFVFPQYLKNVTATASETFLTINTIINSRHSDTINKTGIPLFDSDPWLNNYDACYVLVTNKFNGKLEVKSGPNLGKYIFGLTKKGSSISDNSFEIHWYCVDYNLNLNTAVQYTWENDQETNIHLVYGYFKQFNEANELEFKKIINNLNSPNGVGIISGTAGGDLQGLYPNPQVKDLTISGEVQGSILYYNGTNWVQLPPGSDGYVLSTHGNGNNPTWVKQNFLPITGSGQFVIYDIASGQYVASNAIVNEVYGNILVNNNGNVIFE